MAFKLKSVDVYPVPIKGPYKLANSITVKVGELIAVSSGGVVTNTTASVKTAKQLIGVAHGFTDVNGNPLVDSQGKALTQVSTGTSGDKYVVVIPAYSHFVFEADVNDNLGTTSGSTNQGYFDAADAGTIDESTYVDPTSGSAPKMFYSHGQAKDETGQPQARKVLVQIVQSIFNL